jgi:hypothetical protein
MVVWKQWSESHGAFMAHLDQFVVVRRLADLPL